MIKRIISVISIILCISIIWIPFHFALKTLLYGDKREIQARQLKTKLELKNN